MEFLVIDAGGTFIKYALMNADGEFIEKGKVKTTVCESKNLENYLETLYSIFKKYEGRAEGIAMSAPGILDSETGFCYTGGRISCVTGHNMVELLQERCKVPVTIENDGKCAALAEKWKGSLKDVKNGIVLVLGTAVGGGLIIDGKIYKGTHFSAGEFSYMAISDEKLDQMTGYWGMTGGAPALIKAVSEETGIPKEELDGIRIFEMAEQGNPEVLKGLDRYTKQLAVRIYNLQVLFDAELVAIGGGISKQPLLIEYIRKHVEKFCNENPLRMLSSFLPRPEVTSCRYFNDSNLIGALYHYMKKNKIDFSLH
ncbi:ROK family protein [Clostridium boliviensis]|uniref:ROK family protein n=1 Tax=Clostridium boliviensis TaxID=318465 RepID=A0ABU4GN67_9CLOT|nr:ROK family protein [Clostridium boliviensis]MDW2799068.1 ROK family protein [Clostridium boliviensis]